MAKSNKAVYAAIVGPDTVLLTLDVRCRGEVPTAGAEAAVLRLEKAIQHEHPEIQNIFIEARSLGTREPASDQPTLDNQ